MDIIANRHSREKKQTLRSFVEAKCFFEENSDNEIYNLSLNEAIDLRGYMGQGLVIRRVHNGWIYSNYYISNSSSKNENHKKFVSEVFVPFTKELVV